MLTFGEVHTGLLQNSTPLASGQVTDVLRPLSGDQIQRFERPIPRAVSSDRPVGVDCRMPSASGTNPHVVGTVLWHSAIVGGHIVQSSAHACVVPADEKRRLPWSHYTAFPGRLETLGKADDHEDIAKGLIRGVTRPDHLDTTAIATRVLDRVQRSALLDRLPAVRTRRTRLRWTVIGTGSEPRPIVATFRVVSDDLRTMEVAVPDELVPGVISLCEDLALHDWLLTTVSRLLELTLTSSRTQLEKADLLRPAVDYFLHLWMPGARVDETLEPVWEALEHRPGFTRQWETSVARIRDQISLSTIELLEQANAALPKAVAVANARPRLGPRPPRRSRGDCHL